MKRYKFAFEVQYGEEIRSEDYLIKIERSAVYIRLILFT